MASTEDGMYSSRNVMNFRDLFKSAGDECDHIAISLPCSQHLIALSHYYNHTHIRNVPRGSALG